MKRAIKYLGFNDLWLMIMGIPVISIIATLMLYERNLLETTFFPCLFIASIFVSSYWLTLRPFLIWYHKKYPDFKFTVGRVFFVLFWVGLIFIGIKFLIGYSISYLFPEIAQSVQHTPQLESLTSLLLIMMMFFLYEGIYYFNKSRLIEIEKNKLEKLTAQHKLNTLKNQVNPHFLFNSLNTLVSIIPQEPELAIQFVQNLSRSYRNILEVRNEKLITIKDELHALQSYIYLLKTRFQGKIEIYETVTDDLMDNFIIPLSLQILIENAVKHNITSKSKPLSIKIYNEGDFIVVQNNLQKKDQEHNSTKIGLSNIQDRYALLVEKNIQIIETDHFFTVKLPIIKRI